MDAVLRVLFSAGLVLACLFLLTLANCIFFATLQANAAKPPPNEFQFRKGFECAQSLWLEEYPAMFRL